MQKLNTTRVRQGQLDKDDVAYFMSNLKKRREADLTLPWELLPSTERVKDCEPRQSESTSLQQQRYHRDFDPPIRRAKDKAHVVVEVKSGPSNPALKVRSVVPP